MNGKELIEQGLRLGIPLWRIEEELDWRENQGPCCAEHDVGTQRKPVVRNSARDAARVRQSAGVHVASR
jgi:hypothetical protein